MAKYDLSFSPAERAALRAMTDEEMMKAAESDPDAQPMTEEMLADIKPGRRIERGKAGRTAAARQLVGEARDEPADT